MWQLSDAARTASEAIPSSEFAYDGAGPWVTPCVNLETIPAHMLQLIALMRRHHPWIRSVSPIRPCERRRDGTLSMHSTGRAADVMVPNVGGPEGLALANWLVENAKPLGVQLVIWDHAQWQGNRRVDQRLTPYQTTTTSPSLAHTNHVHVELTTQPGPMLSPPTAPIAPQLLAFVRAVIAPTLRTPGLIRPPAASSTPPAWLAGAVLGAGGVAAHALATKRPGSPAPVLAGAIAGALVGLVLSPTTPALATSTPTGTRMRY